GVTDQCDLALAAHEQARVRPFRRLVHRDEAVCGDRTALSLDLEGVERLGLDRAADELERRLPDQDLVRLGGLLEPCGDVDRVAGGEPLLGAGHDLAGVDADPSLNAELREGCQHLYRRPACSERIVLVRLWHAKYGHHRVADELLYR